MRHLFYVFLFLLEYSCQSNEKYIKIEIPHYIQLKDKRKFETLEKNKVEFGKMLFESKLLSKNNTISCKSCHIPKFAFTDNKPISEGIYNRKSRHNSSTLVNIAFNPNFMWDNRANKLETQILVPLHDTAEMGENINNLPEKLNHNPAMRQKSLETYQTSITTWVITDALATFMRSLINFDTPLDSFLDSGENGHWTEEEKQGYKIYMGKGKCNTCHTLPLTTNHNYYNLGIEPFNGSIGLMGSSHLPEDFQRFKTPSLRFLKSTAPYFHNGSMCNLAEVIEYKTNLKNKTKDFNPIPLSKIEKKALLKFLKTKF